MSQANKLPKKFIFITGGVTSSLGKGLASASLACLMERRGIKIKMLKMDPYINVDPGTMSPIQHGEVFVTDDGAETDLDLGHYERFTSLTLARESNFTTGQVYQQVIENEREGKYLGKTVQVVPHITNEIKRRIHKASEDADVLLAEIGGTVGDIESLPFLESIRQFSQDVGKENVLFIHLVLIPYIKAAGELKSKPAQHSVKELRSIGLSPDVILCRSELEIEKSVMEKVSLFCNVSTSNVFSSVDLDTIYRAPLAFHEQGLDNKVIELLGMWAGRPNLNDLKRVIKNFENPKLEVTIGVVGKYTELTESYKSLDEALRHASLWNQSKLKLKYIDAEEIEKAEKLDDFFKDIHGILVPGGFGARGTEGKIQAIGYARKEKIPFFGSCLGMQLALVEFARYVVGIEKAGSEEFLEKGDLVIHYMPGQSREGAKGATMRLGAYDCDLEKDSLARRVYAKEKISERHRHRLEVNNAYVEKIKNKGMKFSGVNNDLNLVEILELSDHPFFIGCQYHPEFKSKPYSPHPLFDHFIQVARVKQKGKYDER